MGFHEPYQKTSGPVKLKIYNRRLCLSRKFIAEKIMKQNQKNIFLIQQISFTCCELPFRPPVNPAFKARLCTFPKNVHGCTVLCDHRNGGFRSKGTPQCTSLGLIHYLQSQIIANVPSTYVGNMKNDLSLKKVQVPKPTQRYSAIYERDSS